MARGKQSDEVLAAALVTCGTIREAAKQTGVAERTFYDRMKGKDFQNVYNAAKADILRGAVLNTTRQLQGAVDVIAEIMNDKTANPATRLQAAQTILKTAGKLQENLASMDALAMGKPLSSLELALDDIDILGTTT